jgi:hypothetical protein
MLRRTSAQMINSSLATIHSSFGTRSLPRALTNGCANGAPKSLRSGASENTGKWDAFCAVRPACYPDLPTPFVFITLQIPFPATPFLSHPYKTPGGVTPLFTRNPHGTSYCPLVVCWHPIRDGTSYASSAHIRILRCSKSLCTSELLGLCVVRGLRRCLSPGNSRAAASRACDAHGYSRGGT